MEIERMDRDGCPSQMESFPMEMEMLPWMAIDLSTLTLSYFGYDPLKYCMHYITYQIHKGAPADQLLPPT